MTRYILATLILILQEVILLNTLIFETRQGHYIAWVIHIMFMVATIFDIWVGYRIGKWAKQRYTTGKIVEFANKWTERFHSYVGRRGRLLALFLLGNFSFPYVNSFIAAWLAIPFWEMLIVFFIGNVTFYFLGWFVIGGISTLIPNPAIALPVIVGLTIITILLFKRFRK